jgi:hypothetical protein
MLGACAGNNADSQERTIPPKRVQSIVDSTLLYHGSALYEDAEVSFRFRERDYTVIRTAGNYTYTSSHVDSLGTVLRQLQNNGFSERLDGVPLQLSSKDSLAHAESLNSVVYFTMLPLNLNDAAVSKELVGIDTLDGRAYHQVKVSFEPLGGGIDFEDVYLYWFDVEDYSMDFMAYSFQVNDGGTRFRKAVMPRRVNGILFQDYENYKGPSPDSLSFVAGMYEASRLELLSTVSLGNLKVNRK